MTYPLKEAVEVATNKRGKVLLWLFFEVSHYFKQSNMRLAFIIGKSLAPYSLI